LKAAVYYGPRDVRIEEIADPEPGPGEVLLDVAGNGICGSDLHTYVGSSTGGASMHVPGVVLGHEFAGTVRAVGDGIDDLAVGTVVAVAPIEYCGTCWPCQRQWPQMCRRTALYGGYGRPLHGGLAPQVCVSRRSAFAVPAGLDAMHAALTEPMAVAVHAVRRAPNLLGAAVLVLGAGPIGLGVLAAVTASGASITVVSDPSHARRAAASRFGATAVVDPTVEDPVGTVRDLTASGVDVVFDTTAVHAAFNQGVVALRPRGTLVSVAGWQEPARVEMGRAMTKEIDIRFSITYEPAIDFPATLGLLASGAFHAEEMISDRIALDHVVDLGLEELLHHVDRHLKIMVDPNA
jgi:(R,R)-butanediol dehydrogenase / meso-butanediol dehydrogenase / diacetyl reductase